MNRYDMIYFATRSSVLVLVKITKIYYNVLTVYSMLRLWDV